MNDLRAYTRTTLVISLVTDMERPLPLAATDFSAISALCSASSNICCPLRYLFMVIVTTSSCRATKWKQIVSYQKSHNRSHNIRQLVPGPDWFLSIYSTSREQKKIPCYLFNSTCLSRVFIKWSNIRNTYSLLKLAPECPDFVGECVVSVGELSLHADLIFDLDSDLVVLAFDFPVVGGVFAGAALFDFQFVLQVSELQQ